LREMKPESSLVSCGRQLKGWGRSFKSAQSE
jgi:hypothetical protein